MGYTVGTAGREKAGGRSRLLILFICIAKWGILAGIFAGFVRRVKRCCQWPASPSPSYVWPVEGEVTQSFTVDELVYNETMGDWRTHNGIDVVSKFGGAVFSPSAGEVKLAQTDDALWGGVVEVQSGDVTLRFCGLDEVFVKEGDTLVQGDSIGVAGEVPAEAAAGAHLHVECMQGGQYIDPAKLFG